MAEYGEWNQKGATLSDVTAHKEYGVTREFILAGIRTGKLECREGAVGGDQYLRVLRRQLDSYIEEQLGSEYLTDRKTRTELSKIDRDIADVQKKLAALQARKAELEAAVGALRGLKNSAPDPPGAGGLAGGKRLDG